MRRIPRILLLVAVAGVLAMHGIDAGTTAQHGVVASDATHAAAALHELQLPDPTPPEAADHATGRRTNTERHHVVALCIAALVGALGYAGRRLLGRLFSSTARRTKLGLQSFSRRLDDILRPPPPAWVRLCVLRR